MPQSIVYLVLAQKNTMHNTTITILCICLSFSIFGIFLHYREKQRHIRLCKRYLKIAREIINSLSTASLSLISLFNTYKKLIFVFYDYLPPSLSADIYGTFRVTSNKQLYSITPDNIYLADNLTLKSLLNNRDSEFEDRFKLILINGLQQIRDRLKKEIS